MIIKEENGLRILIPNEGKKLKKDTIITDIVYLGINANENEWTEVDDDTNDKNILMPPEHFNIQL